MTNATVLTKISNEVFRPEKLAPEEALDESTNFGKIILCSKACDGTYHKVNSEVGKVLKESRAALSNGGFQIVINKFHDEDVHGQRYLVYPNGKKALLIGNLFFGLKKLAKIHK
ncbi:hypothetical protein HOD83_00295 [Candidatus Woesearchaeota archaeon]|jgi:hypothetical protein|nr:hypothetical protein [Candidatus Woesearchaeota archaeon]MBT4114641.1 hypothetical protein [Candidatus Woesearchaeota archaeon]MBT4248017.1 hypothetical protein [Candidatus Woesearchaeota archaeon]